MAGRRGTNQHRGGQAGYVKDHSKANLGDGFEQLLIFSCEVYDSRGVAVIKKVATPWKVIRGAKGITGAFPKGKSTVDFMGSMRGRSVAFEAKSTENPTSFPLSKIEEHQVEFLNRWKQDGGIAFALVEFATHRETYRVMVEDLKWWFDQQRQPKGRKSIPLAWFREKCELIHSHHGAALDFLAGLKNTEVA